MRKNTGVIWLEDLVDLDMLRMTMANCRVMDVNHEKVPAGETRLEPLYAAIIGAIDEAQGRGKKFMDADEFAKLIGHEVLVALLGHCEAMERKVWGQ
ncbi:MAG TPA: hypothetical protein VKX17_16370 [Planctomycetota bacterium]|nr:hypothetical protein [Planctomycetota bacterium]